MSKLKTFTIPCIWQAWGLLHIEAKNLKEAKKKAFDMPLPADSEYIDDSFEIDEEGIPIHNENIHS